MKSKVLMLAALPLVAAGCIVVQSADRSDSVQPAYNSPSQQDPSPVAPAASDDPYPVLDAYGNWIDVGDYGRVWQPAVAYDWRPYSNGQWVWTDRGWMWDSDEPFGWVVYHYGEWTQMPALGWVWIPGTEWSPARVDWYTEGDYVGWAPMAPPHASYPEVYHPGYENYWTMVPTPQFTRLNVGAYRTVRSSPPPQPGYAPPRGRAVNRPPDIITIQGATHQLISPRKTEQDQVKVGRREVSRVRVAEDNRPAPAPSVYGSGSPAPDNNQQPSPSNPMTPGVLPPGARTTNPRPRTPPVVAPPPLEQRAPTPIRVTPVPAPVREAPAPAPVHVTPAPVQNRSLPAPAPVRATPQPAPVRATPAPAPQRVSVPERKPPERAPDNKRK